MINDVIRGYEFIQNKFLIVDRIYSLPSLLDVCTDLQDWCVCLKNENIFNGDHTDSNC